MCVAMYSVFSAGEKFISCGKDGRLIQHFMENAVHPIHHANTVAIDYSASTDELMISRRRVACL